MRVGPEVFLDQRNGKNIVPGRNGGMGRKNVTRRRVLCGLIKCGTIIVHRLPDALQPQKSRMPFIHVTYGGLYAQSVERAHAANTQQNFLPDARLTVPTVKLCRNFANGGWIFRQIGIEQIKGNAPNLHFPYPHPRFCFGKCESNGDIPAAFIADNLDGQRVVVIFEIFFLLPTVICEILIEIAVLIQQAHRRKWQPQCTRRFEMIPGQHTQTTRINRQAFGETKLRRKIGNLNIGHCFAMGRMKIGLAIHKRAERLGDTLKMRPESRIL